MEEFGCGRYDRVGGSIRRKRSQMPRRPLKPDAQSFTDARDHSPSSATPPSDDASKASSDDNIDTSSRRKEFNLNQCMSRVSSTTECEGERYFAKDENGGFNSLHSKDTGQSSFSNKRASEGVLAPANWKKKSRMNDSFDSVLRSEDTYRESQSLEQSGVALDAEGNDNKVKKVKLKVGGVTRTIQANSFSNGSTTNSEFSETSKSRQKRNLQGFAGDDRPVLDKRNRLQGIPWKDFSVGGFSLGKESTSMGKISGKNTSGRVGEKSEAVRKSKRVPKRRALDLDIDEDYEDDEIRFLEKLKAPKIAAVHKDDEESNKKQRKVPNGEKVALKSVKNGKKKASVDRAAEETHIEEDGDVASDGELEGTSKKKQKKEFIDVLMDGKREMTLTTRQRAMQSKDGSANGSNLIEFPNGLPPAPSRKQKETLTEVEKQIKKTEQAQKRRLQVEKAARETEAEAIKKILGQDSNRKKREDKIKKRQEELAQERAARANMVEPNTIRLCMGPTGTIVTFSNDIGLPSIFDSKPRSYPPPREKCAGPSCTNPYRYRDSKSKLPLCSLQCYKAVQAGTQAETS
ncbi:HIT zinc finger PAPA-1-like conserved region [Euphorbia peplus]|nr:HIT zinc finger PAPA-1-like conserved region [Euphorbia peplus]